MKQKIQKKFYTKFFTKERIFHYLNKMIKSVKCKQKM